MAVTQEPGVVMRSTGSFYRVRTDSGQTVDCTLRGKFRLEDSRDTNPIAVGDRVDVAFEQPTPVIATLHPRDNHILRKATKMTSRQQVLCANVDQAFIVATVDQPFTPFGYIDSFLVMCAAYHIPAFVVINKIDLITTPRLEDKLERYVGTYLDIGYEVLELSALNALARADLSAKLAGKTTFIAGPSGAGKSTLANMLDPSLSLRTNEISRFSGKGKHTTTYAEMYPLAFGGFLIDAPGFREFSIVNIDKAELAGYFPEMQERANGCQFANCLHENEPHCAVKAAVETGDVPETRYFSYLAMLEPLKNPAFGA